MNDEGKKPCLGCGKIHDDDDQHVTISDETRERFHKDLKEWTDHLQSQKIEDVRSLVLVKEIRDTANPDAAPVASALFGGNPAAVGETIIGVVLDFVKRYPTVGPYMATAILAGVSKLGGADVQLIPIGDDTTAEDIDQQVTNAVDRIKAGIVPHTKH